MVVGKIVEKLAEIVGPEYVSDRPEGRYLYSMDPGTMDPRMPDIIAMPGTAEEVLKIVRLTNEENIPVVPMGAGSRTQPAPRTPAFDSRGCWRDGIPGGAQPA